MNELEPADLETDPRFPSGPWTGFYLQYWLPGRHETNVSLTFRQGQLTGWGSDVVGTYTVDGAYDRATGACQWTKQYDGKHAVGYRGVNEGHGIWGVWQIPQMLGLFVDRGGFHIWPEGVDVRAESDEAEKALLATMRKEFGSKAIRALCYLLLFGGIAAAAVAIWMQRS